MDQQKLYVFVMIDLMLTNLRILKILRFFLNLLEAAPTNSA